MVFRFFFHIPLGLALLIVLPGVGEACYANLLSLPKALLLWPLLVGAAAGMVLAVLIARYCPAIAVWEHELTHAISGLPFGLLPYRIIVERGRGGVCKHIGCLPAFLFPFARDFVTLAPYILPTTTVLLVMLRPLISTVYAPVYDLGIGITFGYHLLSTLGEIRQNWTLRRFHSAGSGEVRSTDIAETGMVFSAVYIVTMTLAIHGVLLAIMLEGYPGITAWGARVWAGTLPVLSALAQFLRAR